MKKTIIVFLVSILIALLIASYQELIFLFRVLLYSIAGVVILSAFGGIILLFLMSREWYKVMRAKRIEQEKSAHVMIVSDNGETWIRDTDRNAEWCNLTGAPHLRVNGHYVDPTPLELELYRMKNSRVVSSQVKEIPAEIDRPNSLFDLLESYPHLMFVGGTGSGKTTLMNWCIEYHLKQDENAKVVWLSTHAALDASNIHSKAFIVQKGIDIAKILNKLFREYSKRRDEASIYEKLVICLDEWPEILDETEEWIKAGDILKRMSRGSRKTNISLILASHGGNVNDLGIAGHSSVKLDFAEILLNVRMKEQNKAYWVDNREKVEISIPGMFNGMSKEQEWLELVQKGMSKNRACQQVYGRSFAGDLVDKLNGVLNEYN